jgi:hypothetical protein
VTNKTRGTKLTKRELATVLAALRYWQVAISTNGGPPISEHFFNGLTPLTDDEIDELCDRLNIMRGH